MTLYQQYGPFTDGSAPGINSTFLNSIETFLLSVAPGSVNTPMTPVVTNGTSGGTITIWTFFGGTPSSSVANIYKLIMVYFYQYQNSTTSRQRITLPVPFATGGIAQVGGIHVPTSGTGIYTIDNIPGSGGHNWNVFNGFNSSLSQAILPCYSIGEFNNQMSYMDIDGSTTGPANGWVRLQGV